MLEGIVNSIKDFNSWNHSQKILFFGWFIQTYKNKSRFSYSDVRECYVELSLAQPSNIGPYFMNFVNSRPPKLISDRNGYYLERSTKDFLHNKYGQRESTVAVQTFLSDLPSQLPNLAESIYLQEALICFRNNAFRAAIIMTWNLAYDHLCQFILDRNLIAFNIQLPKSFPKGRISSVLQRDDFSELKESEVLQICKSSMIFNQNIYKVFKEKLDRRNMAAHPSTVTISQVTTEDFILDLVQNAILKLG